MDPRRALHKVLPVLVVLGGLLLFWLGLRSRLDGRGNRFGALRGDHWPGVAGREGNIGRGLHCGSGLDAGLLGGGPHDGVGLDQAVPPELELGQLHVGGPAALGQVAERLFPGVHGLGHETTAFVLPSLLDGRGLELGVLERDAARLHGPLDQVLDQALELGARELHGQMLRTRLVGGDEGEIDLCLRGRGEFDLGLLRGLLQPLERELVASEIDPALLLEFVREIVDEAHVEVLAAEEGVAIGRLHLEHAVTDLQNGDVEGAAT